MAAITYGAQDKTGLNHGLFPCRSCHYFAIFIDLKAVANHLNFLHPAISNQFSR